MRLSSPQTRRRSCRITTVSFIIGPVICFLHTIGLMVKVNSSSFIGTTAHCGLWPVEQYPSIFFLSTTNSLHLLTPNTWRSLRSSSFHPSLGLPLLLVPSSSWVKFCLGFLSSILSRWPNQFILCPFIHFTIFSPVNKNQHWIKLCIWTSLRIPFTNSVDLPLFPYPYPRDWISRGGTDNEYI